MEKRKLSLIAIVLASILLLILMYILFTTENVLNGKENKQWDTYKIINNNSFLVQYGPYAYYVPEVDEQYDNGKYQYVCRTLIDDTSGEQTTEEFLKLRNSKLDSKLMIFENKLFFVQDKNTYKSDISSVNVEAFCNGVIQYIDNKKAVSLINGSLYSVPYFESTFLPKKYQKIVVGNLIFLQEDNDMLYYYSINDVKNITVIGVDKGSLEVTIYNEKINDTNSIQSLVSTKHYIFYLALENERPYIMKINKNKLTKQKIDIKDFTDVDIFSNDDEDDIYFWGKGENGEEKIYVCEEGTKTPIEYAGPVLAEHQRRYEVKCKNNEVEVYKDKELFTTFKVDIEELVSAKILDVVSIDNSIYLKMYYTNLKNMDQADDEYENISTNDEEQSRTCKNDNY